MGNAAQRKKILRIAKFLRKRFGIPQRPEKTDLLDSLIQTILSQSTTDHNRDLAFHRLKREFSNWDSVANAKKTTIELAIHQAGLGNQKAERIRAFLRWLQKEKGNISLEFLHEKSTEEAIALLTRHKGVGVKTAYVTLMQASGRDLFPVDVHIHRIFRRLDLIGLKTTPEKTHHEVAPYIPKGRAFELHMNLLSFGRTTCTARNPKCSQCDLTRMCQYFSDEITKKKCSPAKPNPSIKRKNQIS
jgi:endonuclease-3